MSEALLVFLLFFAILAVGLLLYKNFSLRAEIETRARQQYETWRANDLAAILQQYEGMVQKETAVQFQRWRQESEEGIRKDAIEKSRAGILGKVSEHLIPFFPTFPHNPKDARFIGTPVDFVVFDGLDDGEVRKIVFVEVKTGSSPLSTRERQVRNVVKQQVVEWEELRIPASLV
jgi:predicted Holliday junction resolvase-like endonuclease